MSRAFFILVLLLAGCGGQLTPQPPAAPQILEVQVTPALEPLRPLFQACIEAQLEAGLVVTTLPAQALEAAGGPALRWGGAPPEGAYAAEIAREELVVVVHPGREINQISLADLRAIYTGQMSEWPGSGETIQAYSYPAGDDIQAIFEGAVLDDAQVSRQVSYLAPDPAAVLESVAGNREAIGYLPRRWLNEEVKQITVEGIEGDRLRQPVLAISRDEPAGPALAWLVCLQKEMMDGN